MEGLLVAVIVGAGGMGLYAFIATQVKLGRVDNQWRSLIKEIREELTICHEERGELRAEVESLSGEVISLRGDIHNKRWKEEGAT